MKNPYDILGVPHGASMEQVNAAYRELSRKYAGDGSDAAMKKMEELNQAYDEILLGSHSAAGYSAGSGAGDTADYSDIRSKIGAGRLDDAQVLLDGIPEYSRSAEWYYLKGTVMQKRGWLEEAAKNFATASNLDPSNNTYKMAFNKVNNARNGGYRTERRSSRRGSDSGCDACDLCTGLICADCCCECFGGDIIPCC